MHEVSLSDQVQAPAQSVSVCVIVNDATSGTLVCVVSVATLIAGRRFSKVFFFWGSYKFWQ
jgi:hypothetical protein